MTALMNPLMSGTLSRATQILYRVNPRTSSAVDTLTLDADGHARWEGHGREATGTLPAGLFAEIVARLEQYSFKSVTGVHGDAMADFQHEIEVHEGPKKRSRCTLRVNHESGSLLGVAPTGMKEMMKLLDLIVARVQLGIPNDDPPEQIVAALLRQIDFPYVNPHGEPGAFALIDRRGELLPVSNQRFTMPFSSGLLPVRIEDKMGFVRPSGELVIPAAFLLTLGFSEELAAVKVAEGWGYIDTRGIMVIPPQFAAASNFSDGLAHVHRGHHGGFIDKNGNFFADPPHASHVGKFAGGFAPYRALSRIGVPAWGFVDRHGAVALPPTFDTAGEFSEGLAAVQQDDLYGYIDASFEFVTPPQFTDAGEFHGGLAPVGVDGVTGYCDKTGTLVIPPRFTRGGSFAEELAPVVVGTRTGFIDRTGRMVIEPAFDTALPFSEGLAAVRINHRWGYIDRTGRRVVEPIYETALPFSGGMACVRRFADPKPVVHTGSKKVIVNLGGKRPPG
jgi:hypothetical protein